MTIASGETVLDLDVFSECTSLKDAYYGGTPYQWEDKCLMGFLSIDPNPTVHIACGSGVYYTPEDISDCEKLTVSKMGEGTGAIGESAFAPIADQVKTVVIEDGVTSIGTRAFAGCAELESIEIPSSVTSIEPEAFDGCGSLTSVTVPASVTTIGSRAFQGLSGQNHIFVDNLDDGTVKTGDDWSGSATVHWKHTVTTAASPEAGGGVGITSDAGKGPYWDMEPGTTGSTVIKVKAAPKAGYVLAKLACAYDGAETDITEAKSFDMPDADVTVMATFEVQKHTVKFVNYDGTVLQSGKIAYGEMPKYEGATPTRPETAEYTYAFKGWEPALAKVTGDATYTATYAEKAKKGVYKVVSGAGGTWTQGSGDPLAFTFKRTVDDATTFDHFAGIKVDGKAVPEKNASGKANWTVKRGSVIVSLQPSYLSTLPTGKHTLTAVFDDGNDVDASFTIAAKAQPKPKPNPNPNPNPNPRTGDSNGGLVAALFAAALLSLCLVAVSVAKRRRTE